MLLLPSTKGLVNAELIKLMKPTVFPINMARGPLRNTADVVTAMRDKRIASAGSDVFEVKRIRADMPPFLLDNFVGTPDMSAHTQDSMIWMSMVAKDVKAVLEGKTPEFPVL